MRPAYKTFLFLVILLLSACQNTTPTSVPTQPAPTPTLPRPTRTPYVAVFEVFPEQTRQPIAHIGSGDFIHYFGGTTSATEPISEMNIALLQPRFARVSMELAAWEPVNDNADPLSIEKSAFVDDAHNHATFELMQQFQAQGVELTASIWRVPDWLVDEPEVESPRVITRTMYTEAVESIAAWLLHAKDIYGVEVDYVSFNEANLGVTVLLSSEDYVEMIRLSGARFAELGLKTKWLLGDCASINGCLDYVKPIWATEDIHPYLGPLAFHNWDGSRTSDNVISALGNWAAEQGLEARCTEGGWDAQLWQRSEEFPSWDNAHQLMVSYNRTIKMSGATAFYYWEMMGGDYALNDGSQPYISMQLLRQLNEAFPPGSQVVATSPNTSSIALFAARTPDGGFGIHLVNKSVPDLVRINGLPEGEYQLFLFEENALDRPAQSINTQDGSITFTLPGFSVGYLVKK
jgi:hypothetical protein